MRLVFKKKNAVRSRRGADGGTLVESLKTKRKKTKKTKKKKKKQQQQQRGI
jgi:hypothetical protein